MSDFSNVAESLVGLPELLLRLRSALEASGLRCSPYIIDHSGNTPAHLLHETFSLDIQSDNTGKNRDTTPIRMGHSLTVTVVWKVRPTDMFMSQVEAASVEEKILRSVGLQADTAEIRITYGSTSRALTPAREHLIIRTTFRIEHDWYGAPLE